MRPIFLIVFCSLASPFTSRAQSWCESRGSLENENVYEVVADRFLHVSYPFIRNADNVWFESALYVNHEFTGRYLEDMANSVSAFNAYWDLSFIKPLNDKLEMGLTVSGIVFRSGKEIENYGGKSPKSAFSIAAKYRIYGDKGRNRLALDSRFIVPANDVSLIPYTVELKLLYSMVIGHKWLFTTNLGGAYLLANKVILLYNIETRYRISDRVDIIGGCYRNFDSFLLTGTEGNHWFAGLGWFLSPKMQGYLTFEDGTSGKDLLDAGRLDIGMAWSF